MSRMKDVQDIIEWVHSHVAWVSSLKGQEIQCEALVEWLELEQRASLRRGGVIVARIGVGAIGFLTGASLAALAVASIAVPHGGAQVAEAVIALAVVGSAGAALALRLFLGRTPKPLVGRHRDRDALGAIAYLQNVNGYRGLRKELGEHGVMELNEGAQMYLRCRSILTAAPWLSESPEDPWAEARDDLLRAMESAMDRMTLFVVKKRPFSEISPVLDEMRTAANEIARITEQRATVGSGAGRDLRTSLARMKELAAAEDELLRVREL